MSLRGFLIFVGALLMILAMVVLALGLFGAWALAVATPPNMGSTHLHYC